MTEPVPIDPDDERYARLVREFMAVGMSLPQARQAAAIATGRSHGCLGRH